ncbi:chain length determinant protein EpsF [Glaciimonas sp. GNP009]
MNFTQFLLILRARYKIILITLLATVVTTLVVSLILPKSYKATTSLVVNYKGIDPVTGIVLPAVLMPGYMATQVDIISSRSVALRVVDDLKLAEGPVVKAQFITATEGDGTIRDWLADLLLKKMDVVPSRESSVIDISFKGADPQFTAVVANAFASAYLQVSTQLKIEPSQKASGYFNNQLKQLREKLEQTQNKLSVYQQAHGIVNADNRLDVESARLNDLSTQLVQAQGLSMEANSRQRQAQGSAGASPDVLANSLIQNLKASLSIAEAKFADTSQHVAKNHPQYLSAKSELDKLRSNLDEQIKLATSGVAGNAHIFQQREAEIRSALAVQTNKVMVLNSARDELKVLTTEMENAQRAYEGAALRYSQTNIEGQSNQTDIAILNPAIAPILPSNPRVILNTLVAIFLGTMLGLGFGLMAELMDRRVRSTEDMLEVLQAPVLGVLQWKPPTRERIRFFNRFLRLNTKAN